MPMGKLDFLLGYALAFALIAVVQAVVVVSIALYALDLDIQGAAWQLGVVAVLDGVLGTALGLFASAFAATEFQAVQMMPAVMIPQILLCGLLVPRDQLPDVLHAVSDVLPLSYAVDAVTRGCRRATDSASGAGGDALIVTGLHPGCAGPAAQPPSGAVRRSRLARVARVRQTKQRLRALPRRVVLRGLARARPTSPSAHLHVGWF